MTEYPRHALVLDLECVVDWDYIRSGDFLLEHEASYFPTDAAQKRGDLLGAHHTKWWMDNRRKWVFSPLTSKIVCLGFGDLWSEEIGCVHVSDTLSEADLLADFAWAYWHDPQVITGYNVRRFDIPFITTRASLLDVKLPPWWPHERDYRHIADVMDVTGGGKLDEWLVRCGLPAKTASGERVEWMTPDERIAYNTHDVEIERQLCRRFAPNMPALRTTRRAR